MRSSQSERGLDMSRLCMLLMANRAIVRSSDLRDSRPDYAVN